MADRIRGLTIVLGADSSAFIKSINECNSAIAKTQSNLKDINKALKLDPANVNLLKDKQSELATAINQSKEKLEEEKRALEQMEQRR